MKKRFLFVLFIIGMSASIMAEQLPDRIGLASDGSGLSAQAVTTVLEASGEKPGWISNTPQNTATAHFVFGLSRGQNLDTAKQQAFRSAAQYLQGDLFADFFSRHNNEAAKISRAKWAETNDLFAETKAPEFSFTRAGQELIANMKISEQYWEKVKINSAAEYHYFVLVEVPADSVKTYQAQLETALQKIK